MIVLDGEPIGGMRAAQLVRKGIALVPEGRRLFPSLSVEENLIIGSQAGRPGYWTVERIYELFPVLRERRNHRSMSLSGGQQQMVAIGRALMSNPRLLLCDELSLGLAPIVVREIYQRLPSIVAEGTAVVIVEQDIVQAAASSTRLYCLQEGRVSLAGNSASLEHDADPRRLFRDVNTRCIGSTPSFRAFSSAASMRCSPPACRSSSGSCGWSTSPMAT